jgi:predicted N-acetyltransferase YhbS
MQPFTLRSAQPGDGQAVFDVTRQSIAGLANGLYTPEQLSELILRGRMVVAVHQDRIVGFVDAEPGEVTRLFLLREASGTGLGAELLKIGIANAHAPGLRIIKVESTLNAENFYKRHGFVSRTQGVFSHGVGGQPIGIVHMELEVE